jgi:hypothetical protein
MFATFRFCSGQIVLPRRTARGLLKRPHGKSWRSIVAFRRGVKRKLAGRGLTAPHCRRNRPYIKGNLATASIRIEPRMFRHTALLAMLAAVSPGAMAYAGTFHGEYTVSYLGLTVVKASFDSRYDGDSYTVDGRVAAAGLARLFDDTTGTLRATGRVTSQRVVPQGFRADYTSGKKASMLDIRFSGGAVASTKVLPPPKPRPEDWVAIDLSDLKGVLDPTATTIVPAADLDSVCNRTVRIYDGEMRANLTLSLAAKGEISVPGYKGPTVTCRMQFEPVSGYRKGRKGLQYLRTKSRILVTFAPLGQTGVYAPIRATVGTEIGTLTVNARRFETTQ